MFLCLKGLEHRIGEKLHLLYTALLAHVHELDPDVIVITGFVRGMVLGDHGLDDYTLAEGPVGAGVESREGASVR